MLEFKIKQLLLTVEIWIAHIERMGEKDFVPVIAAWKIPLLSVMMLDNRRVSSIYTYIDFHHNIKLAPADIIVALLCLVGMGAIAQTSRV